VDVNQFEKEAKQILSEVEKECGWMYETQHTVSGVVQKDQKGNPIIGKINYTVWSDVFICPNCSGEIIFWNCAVNKEESKVNDKFPCPNCKAELTKRTMERARKTKYDPYIDESIKQAKQVPVLMNYTVTVSGKQKRFEKEPDKWDLELIEKIEKTPIPYWIPTYRMPEGYNTEQPKKSHGITHVHHFYTKRNLWVLSLIENKRARLIRSAMTARSSKLVKTLMSNYFEHCKGKSRGGWAGTPLMGTLYAPSISTEPSPLEQIKSRTDSINNLNIFKFEYINEIFPIFCNSTTNILLIKNNSIDYIFTDPPFGGNIMYSELSFLWESWLKVFTNNKSEAVVNNSQ